MYPFSMKKFGSVREALGYVVWRTLLAVCWIITGCSLISKLTDDGAAQYESTRGMVIPLLKRWDTIGTLAAITIFIGFLPAIGRWMRRFSQQHPGAKHYAVSIISLVAMLAYWQLHWIPSQLEAACRSGNLQQLARVLAWGGSPHAYPFNTRSLTPMREAIFFDQPAIVDRLCKRGVKETPDDLLLHYAIRCGIDDPELIQILLDHGCNPLLKNRDGLTALEHAEQKSAAQTIRLLRKAAENSQHT